MTQQNATRKRNERPTSTLHKSRVRGPQCRPAAPQKKLPPTTSHFFFFFVVELADGQGRESPFQAQARRDDDTSTVLSTAVTRPKPEFVTSHDVTFSGFGPGTAGPARSLQADTPLSWHGVPNYIKKMTQVIN